MASIELPAFTFGGPPQPPRLWDYYKCVKKPQPQSMKVEPTSYLCSKTRVPFFEISDHIVKARAPAILPDSLQRTWIHTLYPSMTVWPPTS